jgi:hypothetical protein
VLRNPFRLHRSALGEHFRAALHDLRGVIAHGNDGIGAVFGGILSHQFVGRFAGILAEFSQDGDLAVNRPQSRSDRAEQASRPDTDSADDAGIPHEPGNSRDAVTMMFSTRVGMAVSPCECVCTDWIHGDGNHPIHGAHREIILVCSRLNLSTVLGYGAGHAHTVLRAHPGADFSGSL